jgi:hypothetical protein
MSRLQTLLAIFAVIAPGFFINLLISTFSVRADLTERSHLHSSQKARVRLLTNSKSPVALELYVSRSDVKLRPYLESYFTTN